METVGRSPAPRGPAIAPPVGPLVRASVRPSVGFSPGRPGSAAGGTRGWAGPGRGRGEEPERQVRDPGARGRGGRGGEDAPPLRLGPAPRGSLRTVPNARPEGPLETQTPPPELGFPWTGRRIGSPSPVGMCRATRPGEVRRSSQGRPRCAPAAARYPLPGAPKPQLPQQREGPTLDARPQGRIPSSAGASGLGGGLASGFTVSGCHRQDRRPETREPCAPSTPGRRGFSSTVFLCCPSPAWAPPRPAPRDGVSAGRVGAPAA